MNLENIPVGTYNEFAVKALQKVCENPGKDYPLLIIEGYKGSGMSYIAKSLLEEWSQEESILLIKGRNFVNEFIGHLLNTNYQKYTKYLEKLDILILDEIEVLRGKTGTQDAFYTILKNRLENKLQTIIITRESLSSKDGYYDDLYALFQGGLRVQILKPSFEDKKLMVRSLAKKHQLKLSDDVLEKIALSVKDSFYEIQGTILNLKANKKLLNDDSFLVNIIPPQMKNTDPARFLRIPETSMWFGPANHPMTSMLEEFFEKEGSKIKITRVFPGSLLDVFEFKSIGAKLSKKSIGEIVSKFELSIGVSNLSFWDYVSDPNINSDRMAIQIPKSCYKFKLPKVKFLANKKNDTQIAPPPQDQNERYYWRISKKIEEKLNEFNITARIINIFKGQVVDTFELEMGAGVKVARVVNRSEDLSHVLSVAHIRMVYPMKGKTTIGIEVPKFPRDLITLDEVLNSPILKNSPHRLPIAMGKDSYGVPTYIDLALTPHLLVAGTTGSGRSSFVNTLIVSLFKKLPPKMLRFILIDPKEIVLSIYENLPHLALPVVTTPQMASLSLKWAIEEMERRYSIFKDFGLKNIEAFNKNLKTARRELIYKIKEYYPDADTGNFEMPYIVIIVDEFADLKLSRSGISIETSISQLAAKARASGIHIVLCTQRPTHEIINGVIKANFPTRIAFRVTTGQDSRVIIDSMGAEKLLGKGDMLYKHGIEIQRLHSAYIDEEEIEEIIKNIPKVTPQYDASAIEFIKDGRNLENDNEEMEYKTAVNIVLTQRIASPSHLQRKMGIGYVRAASLIDEMEKNGVVGPALGSKPREILQGPPEK